MIHKSSIIVLSLVLVVWCQFVHLGLTTEDNTLIDGTKPVTRFSIRKLFFGAYSDWEDDYKSISLYLFKHVKKWDTESNMEAAIKLLNDIKSGKITVPEK